MYQHLRNTGVTPWSLGALGNFWGLNVIDPIHAWWCLSKSLVSFPYWLRKIVVTRYKLSIVYVVVKEGTHQEYCLQIQTDEFLLFVTLLTPNHHLWTAQNRGPLHGKPVKQDPQKSKRKSESDESIHNHKWIPNASWIIEDNCMTVQFRMINFDWS